MARRLPGKKIDTWVYRKGTVRRKVPVRLVKDSYRGSKTGNMMFCVILDAPHVDLRDLDPNALKDKVFAELDAFYVVDWKPYLHINVDLPSKPDKEFQGTTHVTRYFRMAYSHVVVGKTRNGKNVWCEKGENENEDYLHEGRPETGVERSWDGTQEMHSLVPDTPENETALENIIRALDETGEKLKRLLSQKQVKKTLAQVILKMLPLKEGKA